MSTQDDESADDGAEGSKPSREERQHDAAAFSELAEKLVKGHPSALPDPPFDDVLRKAIVDARGMVKSARPRQIRLVARLLREAAPIADVRAALEGRTPAMRAQQAQEQSNEAWRKRLLDEGDVALAELISEYPKADRARLRQLARQARRTPPDVRSKKAGTKLIREIRALAEAGERPEIEPLD